MYKHYVSIIYNVLAYVSMYIYIYRYIIIIIITIMFIIIIIINIIIILNQFERRSLYTRYVCIIYPI